MNGWLSMGRSLLLFPLRVLLRLLRGVFLVVAALVLWIEEWGWKPLAAIAARLGEWPPLARLEDRVRQTTPRVALALFLIPALALFPLKLAALWLIHKGHGVLGVALIVSAKVLGTALVGRLFILEEPQLMEFPWLARALFWWRETKLRVKLAVQASATWRGARRLKRWVRMKLRRWRHLDP